MTESDDFRWLLTGFYGWPETKDRFKSWLLLSHISSFADGSWMCIGDFNKMLCSTEKLSSLQLHLDNLMRSGMRWRGVTLLI